MSLMIQEHVSSLEICLLRKQQFRKHKKTLGPQKQDKLVTSVESHFANMTDCKIKKGKEENTTKRSINN